MQGVWCGLPGFYPSVSPDAAAAAPVDFSWTSIPSAEALETGTLEIISAPSISPRPGLGLVAMATGLPVVSSSITAQFARAVELALTAPTQNCVVFCGKRVGERPQWQAGGTAARLAGPGATRRLGVARVQFTVPESIDAANPLIAELFEQA